MKRAAAQSQNQPRHGAGRVDLAHPNCMSAMQAIGLACAVITARGDDAMLLATVSFLLLPLLLSPPLLLLVLVLAVVVMALSVTVAVAVVALIAVADMVPGISATTRTIGNTLTADRLLGPHAAIRGRIHRMICGE